MSSHLRTPQGAMSSSATTGPQLSAAASCGALQKAAASAALSWHMRMLLRGG
jgi:hypothetical protein